MTGNTYGSGLPGKLWQAADWLPVWGPVAKATVACGGQLGPWNVDEVCREYPGVIDLEQGVVIGSSLGGLLDRFIGIAE